MPKFGAFQTVSEISRGALATVWSARREGDDAGAAPKYVIKACKPEIDIAGAEQAALAVRLFLEQAELQQRIGKQDADTWAPIITLAQTTAEEGWGGSGSGGEGGAYYVTQFYSWSLERLAARRFDLDTPDLIRFARGIMRGLASLRSIAGRSHGNLKPGNVLLAGEGEPQDLNVRLSDPMPESHLDAGAGDAADLRAMAETIVLLITLQPFRERGGWPIPDSIRWSRLAGGAGWLTLCNRLLDPSDAQPKATFEEVEAALAEIEKARAPGGGKKKLIIGLAAGLVLAAGAVTAYILTRPPPPPPTPVRTLVDFDMTTWQTLCDAYLKEGFDQLDAELSRPMPGAEGSRRLQVYAQVAPGLAATLGELAQKIEAYQPRTLAKADRNERMENLRESPPEELKDKKVATDIADAVQYIKDLKLKIHGPESELARPLREAGVQWEASGWKAPAAHTSEVVAKLVSTPFSVAAMDAAVETLRQTQAIAPLVPQVAALAQDVTKGAKDDAVLVQFEAWSKAYPGEEAAKASPGLASIVRVRSALQQVQETGEILRNFVTDKGMVRDKDIAGQQAVVKWSEVCHKQFAASPKYQELLAAGKPGLATFNQWMGLVGRVEFARPSIDPRSDDGIKESRIKALRETLAQFGKDAREGPIFDKVMAPLSQARVTLGLSGPATSRAAILSDLASRLDEWYQPYDCDNVAAIKERVDSGKYATVAESLASAAREYNKTREDMKAKVASLWAPTDLDLTTPEILAAWQKWRGAAPADPQSNEASARLEEVTPIRERLLALQKAIPVWSGLAELDPASRASFMGAAEARKLAILTAFLTAHDTDRTWTDAQLTAFTKEVEDSTGELRAYAAQIGNLGKLLTGGYGSSEPAGARETVGSLWRAITANTSYERVKGPLAGLKARVDRLELLEKSSDRSELLSAARTPGGNPEAVLAAWRGLSRLTPAWPSSLAELDTEQGMIAPLDGVVAGLARPASELAELKQAIASERKKRWARFLGGATTKAEIEAALKDSVVAASGGFAVKPGDLNPASDGVALLRWKLHAFTAAVSPLGDDEDPKVKEVSLAFLNDVRPLGAATSNPEIRKSLDAIETHVNRKVDDKPKVDLTKLGPGAVGWTCTGAEPGSDGRQLTFSKGGPAIDFILVQPQTGEPFYLARTELSIEQFKEIADKTSGWDALKELMAPSPGTNSDADPRASVPRAWVPDARAMIRPSVESKNNQGRENLTDWFKWDANFLNEHPYAEIFRDAPDDKANRRMKGPMQPTAQTPMQFVSAGGAVAISRLAGCRLPTTVEWQAAAALAPPSRPNLRDETWKKQFTYNESTLGCSFYGPNPASPTVAPDDGVLWFAPVVAGSPGQFANLIGNVAEFVVAVAEGEGASTPATVLKDTADILKRSTPGLAVIGGSALSRIENLDKPEPVKDDEPQGWADVGVRLAFGAKGAGVVPPSLAKLVKGELATLNYGAK